MAGILDTPLDLDKLSPAQWALLEDLQGNILKGHGRDHAAHIFLHFDSADGAKECLKRLRGLITSAGDQVRVWQRLRSSKAATQADPGLHTISGQLFLSLALSCKGYEKLGINPDSIPQDPAFKAGMRGRPSLQDPPPEQWTMLKKDGGKALEEIHALVIVSCDTPEVTKLYKDMIVRRSAPHARELGTETGRALRNAARQRIEHFGYVDGMSSPVFVLQDLEGSQNTWNPLSPPSVVLERCHGGDENSFGSYLVFRKLEQNPRMFAGLEIALGKAAGKTSDEAGAMVIGRKKDGTSLTLSSATPSNPPSNDFDYRNDTHGNVCPFNAHARKLNPRGATIPSDPQQGVGGERQHWIVRRGIPYGARKDDPTKPASPESLRERPEWGQVGLLFMCYQRSIETQFEELQSHWANDAWFPLEPTEKLKGVDPLIGSRDTREMENGKPLLQQPLWPSRSGNMVPFEIPQCVRLQGGEYFFVPSISFIRKL
jgi:Dyp-type peroxidase family